MSSRLKNILWVIVLAVAAVGGSAVYWRSVQLGVPMETPRSRLGVALFVLIPIVLAIAVVAADRKLSSDKPRLADDHRRYFQISLVGTFVFASMAQIWHALSFLQQTPLGGDAFLRLACIWAGVSLAVRGNFFAKVGPPSGEGAPDRNRWSLAMLKMGWLLVLWGVVLVGCASLLPPLPLFWVFLATAPVLALALIEHRRELRRGLGA